jgi:hypothetical protein
MLPPSDGAAQPLIACIGDVAHRRQLRATVSTLFNNNMLIKNLKSIIAKPI